MRRIVAIVLVAAAAGATAVVLLTTASQANARDRIVAAALAQKSVHVRLADEEDMVGMYRSTADVNADSGTELRRWVGGGTVRILFVDDTVYVRADAAGLVHTFLLTPGQASRYVGQWISVRPEGKELGLYRWLSHRLTLASIVHDVTPAPPHGAKLRMVTGTSRGERVIILQETGISKLSARANGASLPVTFFYGGPVGGTWGRFSGWNEPVHVEAPASSTPIATVRGG